MATSYIKKILTVFFAGILCVTVLLWAFTPAPVAVDLKRVQHAPMEVTVDGEGRTRVHDMYTVSAPVSGRIQRVEVHVGDDVISDQTLLATIEPSQPQFLDARAQAQAEAAVKAAEAASSLAQAELKRFQAELRFAQANSRRARDLFAKQTISEREFDQAELEVATHVAAVDSALATLKVRAFELETARAALINPANVSAHKPSCCVEVRAPVSGKVLRVLRESEGVIEIASPLIEIGDPTRMEIVVDLLSSDAVRIREGATVNIDGWGGTKTLKGQVRRIEPYGYTKISALGIEEQRVNVIIDFVGTPEDWAELGHGFRVEAQIREWQNDNVLQIPVGALFRNGEDWAVFIDDNGTAKLTTITIGHTNGRTVQVLSGLSEAVKVISHPSDRVNDGVKIVARNLQTNMR
ncbi:MAG: efflux RND transporter periplasmic adaptor subunit [Magnetovibrio sp.]|nr:efflux RND transporter periplasmic adaptor subunit [Magnetovibrio sp.]